MNRRQPVRLSSQSENALILDIEIVCSRLGDFFRDPRIKVLEFHPDLFYAPIVADFVSKAVHRPGTRTIREGAVELESAIVARTFEISAGGGIVEHAAGVRAGRLEDLQLRVSLRTPQKDGPDRLAGKIGPGARSVPHDGKDARNAVVGDRIERGDLDEPSSRAAAPQRIGEKKQ